MSNLSKKNPIKEIAEELDVLDDMVSALVEVLEEKGIMTQEEWETKIQSKLEKRSKTVSYRDL